MKDTSMWVTEIDVVPVKHKEGLIGFASCLLNDSIYLGHIAIRTKLDGGLRLVFPAKRVGEKLIYYHHPINKQIYQILENEITKKFEALFEGKYEGSDRKNEREREII